MHGVLEPTAMAANAVVEIGRTLKDHHGKIKARGSKSASAVDVVTHLDLKAEEFLRDAFSRFDPTIGFVGEELAHNGATDRYWLVDPIDGTQHFIRGIPFCTTMVALVEHGEVMASVIYNFVTEELFIAERGRGATRNGKRLGVSTRALRDSYLSVETNLKSTRSRAAYRALRECATIVHTISCGYEFGLIAQGKLDGRICFDPYGHDWDYAPGALLVREAGGCVANIGSGPADYDFRNHNLIAANWEVFAALTLGDTTPLAPYMP